jgi:hypothetical protein
MCRHTLSLSATAQQHADQQFNENTSTLATSSTVEGMDDDLAHTGCHVVVCFRIRSQRPTLNLYRMLSWFMCVCVCVSATSAL